METAVAHKDKKKPAREGSRPVFFYALTAHWQSQCLDVERVLPALGLEAPPAEAFASPG